MARDVKTCLTSVFFTILIPSILLQYFLSLIVLEVSPPPNNLLLPHILPISRTVLKILYFQEKPSRFFPPNNFDRVFVSHRSNLHSKFLRLHFEPFGSTPTTLSRAEL